MINPNVSDRKNTGTGQGRSDAKESDRAASTEVLLTTSLSLEVLDTAFIIHYEPYSGALLLVYYY